MTDVTPIIQAVVALICVIITVIVIPYIRSKTTKAQQDQMQMWINVSVFAAEQMFKTPGSGEAKKNFVLEFLRERGITYDENAVNLMIEAAVKKLNIAQQATNVIEVPPVDEATEPESITN